MEFPEIIMEKKIITAVNYNHKEQAMNVETWSPVAIRIVPERK